MLRIFFTYMLLLFAWLSPFACLAQTDSTKHIDIEHEASVVAWKSRNMLKHSEAGHTHWQMEHLQLLPQILGNADPLRYTQSLPMVQTSDEVDAGLHVQGCASGQNAVLLDDAVIYNPSHLLGIFSTFNANHFSQLDFSTLSMPQTPNRVGGTLKMLLPELPTIAPHKKAKADISIGPMSAQGTLRLMLSPKLQVVMSARQAYMNLLYKKWLTFDGNEVQYSFSDYNLTLTYKPRPQDVITINAYFGNDNAHYFADSHQMQTRLKWSNYAAECSWMHTAHRQWCIRQSVFSSGYTNKFSMEEEAFNFRLPSHIRTHGYHLNAENHHWSLGTEYLAHQVLPQSPQMTNSYYAATNPANETLNHELSIYTQYVTTFAHDALRLSVGTRVCYFHSPDGQSYLRPAPQAKLAWRLNSEQKLTIHLSLSNQFIHQTGFSSLGLPTEFWFASSRNQEPQLSQNLSVLYDFTPTSSALSLTAEAYVKRLSNQKEYNDNVFSLLQSDYSLQHVLLSGKGINYGIGLQLTKQRGRLTGWLSYAFGRSLRKFDELDTNHYYPSNYERLHELNLVVNLRLSARTTLSMVGIAASGTPFTAARDLYLINGYIVAEYGEHNACRLPWYKRIDLSADVQFKPHGSFKHGLNISLLNAFGFHNKQFYRLSFKKNKLKYRPVSFLKIPLPSVSYYLKF